MYHVLIIEDEPFVAMMLEDLFLAEGAATVAVAVTEADAVSAATARRPDFITADVTLAEGTGPAAVDAIRGFHGDVPVLFISALPDPGLAEKHRAAALLKPATARSIIAKFHMLVKPDGKWIC